jgi:predicted Zn-dependent protease with MMP-like domain
VTPELFNKAVAKAIEELPAIFQEKMENVEVIVEDFPDRETMESLELGSRWELLGLYVGVPISHRSVFSTTYLPDRIYLYRRPIMAAAGSSHMIVTAVRDVLLHEIGHHFGFDDEQLGHMTGEDQ